MAVQQEPTQTKAPVRPAKAGGDVKALPVHVVDLGRAKPKAVKQLKRGRGELLEDVADALAEIEENLGSEAAGKTLLPVIIVVEKRRRRRRGLLEALRE